MSKARDIADLDFNSPDIDGGNIDGATIGATTPAAGTFNLATVDGARIVVQRQNDDSSIAFANNSTGTASGNTWAIGLDYDQSESLTFAFASNGFPSLSGNKVFQMNQNGNATFTGSITATSATFTDDVDVAGLVKVGVNNSEYANNYIRFKPTGSAFIDHNTVGQGINFRVSQTNNLDTTALSITSTGSVVGSDSFQLSSGGTGFVVGGGDTGTTAIGFMKNDGGKLTLDTDGSRGIYFKTGGGIRQYIDGSTGETRFYANVGIGIDPAEMLDIKSTSGDARIRLDAPTGSDTEIKFFNNGVSEYTIGHDDTSNNFIIGSTNVDNPLLKINQNGEYYTGNGHAQLVRQLEIPYNVTNGVLTYTFEFMNLSNKQNDVEGSTKNSAMFFVNVNTYLNKYIHMVVTTDLNAGNSLSYQTLGNIGLTGSASIDATNPQITITINGMWSNSSNYSGRVTAS
jgi:hypothetical protein